MGIRSRTPNVLTLDAGGTNFVFSVLNNGKQIGDSLTMPSAANDLKACYGTIVDGFRHVMKQTAVTPQAISFAFPGPADYPNGIIGDLPNLPAFRGGVALGPKLAKEFGVPVFINNDGNLFTLGEASYGLLPQVNRLLTEAGSKKRYANLIGLTLGTGFGGGIVANGNLITGDNSNAGEVWLLRNKLRPHANAEEHIGSLAMQRRYQEYAGDTPPASIKELYQIAIGEKEGNQHAAQRTFAEMAVVLGDSIATLLNVIDGIVVLGGGIAGAHPLFMEAVLNEIHSTYKKSDGTVFNRTIPHVYNLQRPDQLDAFLQGGETLLDSNGLGKLVYNAKPVSGIGITRLGTSQAVAAGAYQWAINNL